MDIHPYISEPPDRPLYPVESPEETKLREEHRKTPAGRLLTRAGFDYWDTESAARRVAEHAAEEIEELRAEMETLATQYDYTEHAEVATAIRAILAKTN